MLQPDGRVLAVGAIREGPWRLFVARYGTNGKPDQTFGRGGIRYLPLGAATSRTLGDTRTALALRPDGTIVAAATTLAGTTVVFRLLPNGAIDSSFGKSRKVELPQ